MTDEYQQRQFWHHIKQAIAFDRWTDQRHKDLPVYRMVIDETNPDLGIKNITLCSDPSFGKWKQINSQDNG